MPTTFRCQSCGKPSGQRDYCAGCEGRQSKTRALQQALDRRDECAVSRLLSHPRGSYRWYACRMPNGDWQVMQYDRPPIVGPEEVVVGPHIMRGACERAAREKDAEDGMRGRE